MLSRWSVLPRLAPWATVLAPLRGLVCGPCGARGVGIGVGVGIGIDLKPAALEPAHGAASRFDPGCGDSADGFETGFSHTEVLAPKHRAPEGPQTEPRSGDRTLAHGAARRFDPGCGDSADGFETGSSPHRGVGPETPGPGGATNRAAERRQDPSPWREPWVGGSPMMPSPGGATRTPAPPVVGIKRMDGDGVLTAPPGLMNAFAPVGPTARAVGNGSGAPPGLGLQPLRGAGGWGCGPGFGIGVGVGVGIDVKPAAIDRPKAPRVGSIRDAAIRPMDSKQDPAQTEVLAPKHRAPEGPQTEPRSGDRTLAHGASHGWVGPQ
jgi:hypothetical protein